MIHERALSYRLTYRSPRGVGGGVTGTWPGPQAQKKDQYAPHPTPKRQSGQTRRWNPLSNIKNLWSGALSHICMGGDPIVLEWVPLPRIGPLPA